MSNIERRFADEDTKKSWELAIKAVKLAAETHEDDRYPNRRITADSEDRGILLTVSLVSGIVQFTEEKGVILVPERTVHVLEKLGIPYKNVLEE